MIKKIAIILIFFLIIVALLFSTSSFKQSIVVIPYNNKKEPIAITPDQYKDRFCNMTIQDVTYSAQAILPNGDTLFFDDVGCLVLWRENQKNKDEIILWVWAKDRNDYIDGEKAWYSVDESTPMNYGFGAYEIKKDDFINFETMRARMISGETMANPKVRKKLLGDN